MVYGWTLNIYILILILICFAKFIVYHGMVGYTNCHMVYHSNCGLTVVYYGEPWYSTMHHVLSLCVYVRFWNNGNNACLIAEKAGEWRRFVELRSLQFIKQHS